MGCKHFYDTILDIAGQDEYDQLMELFIRLRLPAPDDSEFIVTSDGGVLIPVTRYGVTIRVTEMSKFHAESCGHMLDPLGSEEIGCLRFDINPGVALGVTYEDNDRAIQRCEDEGYYDEDAERRNVGYLPVFEGFSFLHKMFPNGVPIYFDPEVFLDPEGLADNFRLATMGAGGQLPTHDVKLLQEQIFGPLKQLYKRFQSGEIEPYDFWRECVHAKREGVLVSGWDSNDSYFVPTKVFDAASHYDEVFDYCGVPAL